jgi:hypothetical protein
MTQATFEIRHHFGTSRAYPTNEAAADLCSLTGSKTLLPQALSTIERLGFLCIDTTGAPIAAADLY